MRSKMKIIIEMPGQEPMEFCCDDIVLLAIDLNRPVVNNEKVYSMNMWQSDPTKATHMIHAIRMAAQHLVNTPYEIVGKTILAGLERSMAFVREGVAKLKEEKVH